MPKQILAKRNGPENSDEIVCTGLIEELKAVKAESLAYLTVQNQVLTAGSAIMLGQLAVWGALYTSAKFSYTWHWSSLCSGVTSCLIGYALISSNRTIGHLANFEATVLRPKINRLAKSEIPSWTKYKLKVNRSSMLITEVAPSPYGIFLFAAIVSAGEFLAFDTYRKLQLGTVPWLNRLVGMPQIAAGEKVYQPAYLFHWASWAVLVMMIIGLVFQGVNLKRLNQGKPKLSLPSMSLLRRVSQQ